MILAVSIQEKTDNIKMMLPVEKSLTPSARIKIKYFGKAMKISVIRMMNQLVFDPEMPLTVPIINPKKIAIREAEILISRV